MTKVFIYMSHKIRQRRPKNPIVALFSADMEKVEGEMVTINGPSVVRFDARGLSLVDSHHVTAWIEADARDVVIR